ncbi:hypothetical protein EDD15DRAFT_2532631 [Pisolithus albus]|nr:hypothetical protein EDD15DRAFT_2532631 [Pisolithus albus]
MADRMSQYQMFSQNIMQTPVQQQPQPQMLQQTQQPQQPADPQMMQGLSNPEAGRMWQQLQNQQNQMQGQIQNSYRLPQSGDLAASGIAQTWSLRTCLLAIGADYARGQAFAQAQGQHSLVQQLQQPFGLNAQRFNAAGTTFHDSHGNQTQPFIPSNFLNMSANTPQMNPHFSRGQMIQPPMNNTNVPRQMQLMTSQNQPNHQVSNGVDMVRLQQAGLGVQQGGQQTADMFAISPNPDQMRGSPHPSSQRIVSLPNAQSQQVQNGRAASISDYVERYQLLRNIIPQIEQKISETEAAIHAGNITEPVAARLPTLRRELASKKQQFQAFSAFLAHLAAQRVPNGAASSNVPHLNLTAPSHAQPHQQVPGSAPPQQSFAAQVNSNASQTFAISSPSNAASPMPAAPQNSAAATQQVSAQMNRPNTLPTRSAAAPHQLSSQAANPVLPSVANGSQFVMRPTNGQGVPPPTRVKPLDAQRFESTYAQFCRSQRMTPNMRVPFAENQVVDLHKLHVEVLQEGGYMTVTQRDWWPVIGGRLGWVQFPGNEAQPARSGPAIAQQLNHAYKEHLLQFESAYMMTVRNRTMINQQQPQQQQQQQPPTNGTVAISGRTPAMPMVPPETQLDPRVLIKLSGLTAAELRAQGVPQGVIDLIEWKRPQLANMRQQAEQARRIAAERQIMPHPQTQVSSAPEPLARGVQRTPQLIPGSLSSIPVGEHKPGGQYVPPISFSIPLSEDQARAALSKFKDYVAARSAESMNRQVIPDDQRLEYNQLLERAGKLVDELDNRLPTYWNIINNEEAIRKFAIIIVTVKQQREFPSTSPQCIINFVTLRNMVDQVQRVIEECEQRLRIIKANVANGSAPPNLPPAAPANRAAPAVQPPTVPQSSSAPMISNSSALLNSSPLPQPPPQPPVIKKSAQSSPSPSNPPAHTAIKSPSPPAASTPTTNAATPQTQTAGSPQTPKSPKRKVGIRPKDASRVRKPSTSAKGAATPEAASTPVAGVKRPPQDETTALLNQASSEPGPSQAPSPKKIRTEWEGEPSEALVKRQQQIENVKTEEDAIAFFDQMRELLAITARADGSVHTDIAASLSEILAGVSQEPEDAAATAAAISAARELDEESDSKAPTPELVPSTEANPSPESGSDADPLTGSPGKTKIEDSSDHIDLLRLGVLREIDGGEAAHYQSDHWKWEGTMQTPEQPWAMLTS